MKLRGLLQKCSFFSPIRLAVFWPAAAARMKLQKMTNDYCRLTNGGIASLSRLKIDRIPLFDVRCWTFDVRCSVVFYSIRLAIL